MKTVPDDEKTILLTPKSLSHMFISKKSKVLSHLFTGSGIYKSVNVNKGLFGY